MFLISEEFKSELDEKMTQYGNISLSSSELKALDNSSGYSSIYSTNGNVADINISGVLVGKKNGVAEFLGVEQTAYQDIHDSIEAAKQAGVKAINYHINSGGGELSGMYETMLAIENSGIPSRAIVSNGAASAAYMLATATGNISATNKMARFGSVGIISRSRLSDNEISVTNNESMNKSPDLKTEEGKQVLRDQLSDVYGVVVEKIAANRGTSIENINKNYGAGIMMTAEKALKAGMIDAIEDFKPASRSGVDKGYKSMNREELKATHPDLFEAILNEGKEAGKAEVKELAEAHLELAKISGDKDRALEDIAAFNRVTPACTVHHTNVAAKNAAIQNRADDAPAPVSEGEPAQDKALDGNKEEEAMEADLLMAAKAFGGKLS